MKKFLFIALLFLIPLSGNAQSAQRWYTALLPNPQGEDFVAVIPNASVFVCAYNDQDQCLTPQPIYSDTALTVPISQPLLADGNGVYSYYVQSGTQVVEKVCAPFDQCASYQVQIGDKINVGPGSGTVTSVSCDNLDPLFTCNVLNNTTSPLIEYTLDTAGDLRFFGNTSGSTGSPSFIHFIAGTNIALTEGTGTLTISSTAPYPFFQTNGVNNFNQTGLNLIAGSNISLSNSGFGVTISASGGGSGGCSSGGIPTSGGIVTGDNTSTNCGFNNRVGDTTPIPARVSTFGSTNLADNGVNCGSGVCGQNNIAIGNNNGANNTYSEMVLIGDTNFPNATFDVAQFDIVAIGDGNLNPFTATTDTSEIVALGATNGTHADDVSELVLVGDSNAQSITNSTEIVALGNSSATTVANADNVVAIGDCAGCETSAPSDLSDLVAIGDAAGINNAGNDFVAIGDASGSNYPDGSSDIVAIGDGAGLQGGYVTAEVVSDLVAIGDAAAKGNVGSNVVGIGNHVLGAEAAEFLESNSGTDNIGIGQYTLTMNTTGSKNVALGGFAGADGFVRSPFAQGNSNLTGSNNTWVGYDSGPNVTTQLSNTIALGYQAHNTASNQTTIGNSSTTSLKLFGCPSGQVTYDDGSGTCFTPAGGGGPSTTVASAEVVSFSATPTFSTSFNVSRIVLTGNITSFTLGTGTDGQDKTLCFKQGSGPYTVAGPANVHGFFTVGSVNAGWNCQSYVYDNTDSIWLATNLGLVNE